MNICNVEIDRYSFDEVVSLIVDHAVKRGEPGYVVTPNAQHVVSLRQDSHFRGIYRKAWLVVPDGVPLLWAGRLLNTPLCGRVNGTDLFLRLCAVGSERGLRIFLLGGRPGAADAAARILQATHPGLNIVGTCCPPYGFELDPSEVERINGAVENAHPDLLFVGLGAPKQEKWIDAHHRALGVPVSVGIGVSFELVAGIVGRAPRWMQGAGLEWFHRLLSEPARLWKRYLFGNAIFVFLVLRQWLGLLAPVTASEVPARGGASPPPRTSSPSTAADRVGIVAIGRNEGNRLRGCLGSLLGCGYAAVYVDSGSTDGSAALARSMGFEVLELDTAQPFSVARARNSGLEHLVQRYPDIEYVQFVDADCVMASGWIERARVEMGLQPDRAAVSGRRRERFPDASPYNRLFEMEWRRPPGECEACGGDVMIRVSAFREVNGYDTRLIGGTDPDFGLRLRRKGWRILQLDAEMTVHDAAMFRFRQWWNRTIRTGYAYAAGAALHGRGPERYHVKPVLSALFWGLALPATGAIVAAGSYWRPQLAWLTALAALAYAVLFGRIYRYRRRSGDAPAHAVLYGAFCVLSKVPQQWGILKFLWHRAQGKHARLIEYKSTV